MKGVTLLDFKCCPYSIFMTSSSIHFAWYNKQPPHIAMMNCLLVRLILLAVLLACKFGNEVLSVFLREKRERQTSFRCWSFAFSLKELYQGNLIILWTDNKKRANRVFGMWGCSCFLIEFVRGISDKIVRCEHTCISALTFVHFSCAFLVHSNSAGERRGGIKAFHAGEVKRDLPSKKQD